MVKNVSIPEDVELLARFDMNEGLIFREGEYNIEASNELSLTLEIKSLDQLKTFLEMYESDNPYFPVFINWDGQFILTKVQVILIPDDISIDITVETESNEDLYIPLRQDSLNALYNFASKFQCETEISLCDVSVDVYLDGPIEGTYSKSLDFFNTYLS